jgi:hypothetical protein
MMPAVTTKLAVNAASAVLGMIGTWLMARRYAREPLRALLFAALLPFILIWRRGEVREFLKNKINLNADVPDSPIDMFLGLNLLFLAFVLQFVAIYLEAGH